MTTLRKAAQAALEALELLHDADTAGSTPKLITLARKARDEAIVALRTALAEPQPEPVATEFHNPWRASLENCISGDNYLRSSEYHKLIEELDDLYRMRLAAPQAQQPLTDEGIAWLWSWSASSDAEQTATTQQHAFARAIERAHGIGMKP